MISFGVNGATPNRHLFSMMAACAAPEVVRTPCVATLLMLRLPKTWIIMLGLFVTCLTELPGAETAFSLYFSKDADMWECAVHTMGRQVMELLALDQSTALQSCRVWPWLTSKQRKCALNACAGLWLWCRIGYAQAFDPFAESPASGEASFPCNGSCSQAQAL